MGQPGRVYLASVLFFSGFLPSLSQLFIMIYGAYLHRAIERHRGAKRAAPERQRVSVDLMTCNKPALRASICTAREKQKYLVMASLFHDKMMLWGLCPCPARITVSPPRLSVIRGYFFVLLILLFLYWQAAHLECFF